MKATVKEKSILGSATISIIALLVACIALTTLVFARPSIEYRQPIAQIVTKSLNTSYQLSTSRDAMVAYSIQIAASLTLTSGQTGSVQLQTSPDNSTWTTISTQTNANTGTLVVGLNTINTQAMSLVGFVPAGYYVRMSTSGTATTTWVCGMQVLL